MNYQVIAWLIILVIMVIAEFATMGLATIWFAGGAFLALVFALFDTGLGLQVAVFLVSSVVLLVSTRKIFVEKLKTGVEKTNVDALLGAEGIVTMKVAPFAPGQAKVKGQIWTIVGQDPDMSIEEGVLIKVTSIVGVKLVVTPSENAES